MLAHKNAAQKKKLPTEFADAWKKAIRRRKANMNFWDKSYSKAQTKVHNQVYNQATKLNLLDRECCKTSSNRRRKKQRRRRKKAESDEGRKEGTLLSQNRLLFSTRACLLSWATLTGPKHV
jgi:hypothetical protein